MEPGDHGLKILKLSFHSGIFHNAEKLATQGKLEKLLLLLKLSLFGHFLSGLETHGKSPEYPLRHFPAGLGSRERV
jgi:hypothetical protein